MTEQEIQQRLLYRDGLILILDKPAGLPVHAGPKGGENLEQYFHFLQFGLKNPPALAHRLDRETSGCLVLGRHSKALRKMGMLFQSGQVHKTYWAIVHGTPPASGVVDAPLRKRSDDPKQWWMEVHPEGQPSVTEYRVLKTVGERSLMELNPKTGRTHQIRVHMAHIGHPLCGEKTYIDQPDTMPMMLHARRVQFKIQASKPPLDITAPLPSHWLPEFCV